jgi:hypothetical protein
LRGGRVRGAAGGAHRAGWRVQAALNMLRGIERDGAGESLLRRRVELPELVLRRAGVTAAAGGGHGRRATGDTACLTLSPTHPWRGYVDSSRLRYSRVGAVRVRSESLSRMPESHGVVRLTLSLNDTKLARRDEAPRGCWSSERAEVTDALRGGRQR